ncbi:MAG: helix-turn-helix domain containing protein [Deltaproteobacteria bacterium]|nr:helix-turn-helix domain containing protein [Deltaproteobacteria bacterium]
MRSYRRLCVRLSKGDREKLDDILSGGVQAVRTVLRALVLCRLEQGHSASEVAAAVRLTSKAVREIGRRYETGGLEQALYERPRPGTAEVLGKCQKQRIIAMVCSAPPEGRARWSVRLVAEEAVKRKLVLRVGRETIRLLLLSHDLKPWREKNVVCGPT